MNGDGYRPIKRFGGRRSPSRDRRSPSRDSRKRDTQRDRSVRDYGVGKRTRSSQRDERRQDSDRWRQSYHDSSRGQRWESSSNPYHFSNYSLKPKDPAPEVSDFGLSTKAQDKYNSRPFYGSDWSRSFEVKEEKRQEASNSRSKDSQRILDTSPKKSELKQERSTNEISSSSSRSKADKEDKNPSLSDSESSASSSSSESGSSVNKKKTSSETTGNKVKHPEEKVKSINHKELESNPDAATEKSLEGETVKGGGESNAKKLETKEIEVDDGKIISQTEKPSKSMVSADSVEVGVVSPKEARDSESQRSISAAVEHIVSTFHGRSEDIFMDRLRTAEKQLFVMKQQNSDILAENLALKEALAATNAKVSLANSEIKTLSHLIHSMETAVAKVETIVKANTKETIRLSAAFETDQVSKSSSIEALQGQISVLTSAVQGELEQRVKMLENSRHSTSVIQHDSADPIKLPEEQIRVPSTPTPTNQSPTNYLPLRPALKKNTNLTSSTTSGRSSQRSSGAFDSGSSTSSSSSSSSSTDSSSTSDSESNSRRKSSKQRSKKKVQRKETKQPRKRSSSVVSIVSEESNYSKRARLHSMDSGALKDRISMRASVPKSLVDQLLPKENVKSGRSENMRLSTADIRKNASDFRYFFRLSTSGRPIVSWGLPDGIATIRSGNDRDRIGTALYRSGIDEARHASVKILCEMQHLRDSAARKVIFGHARQVDEFSIPMDGSVTCQLLALTPNGEVRIHAFTTQCSRILTNKFRSRGREHYEEEWNYFCSNRQDKSSIILVFKSHQGEMLLRAVLFVLNGKY